MALEAPEFIRRFLLHGCMCCRRAFNTCACAATAFWATTTATPNLPSAANSWACRRPRPRLPIRTKTTAIATSDLPASRCVTTPSVVAGTCCVSRPSRPRRSRARHHRIAPMRTCDATARPVISELPCKRTRSLRLARPITTPPPRFTPALQRNRIPGRAPTPRHHPTIVWRAPTRFYMSTSPIDCDHRRRFNAHNSTAGGAAERLSTGDFLLSDRGLETPDPISPPQAATARQKILCKMSSCGRRSM